MTTTETATQTQAPSPAGLDGQKRWLALYLLCMGDVLIVLDSTIVNVALPSIQADLGFSDASLAWVVNAYLLTFGGFLLLGGRLGDLYGRRRLFLIGLALFTVMSLACGLANSEGFLVAARALQGFGGAIVSVVALSLIMILFPEPAERAKAMGIFGFVMSGGGTAGVLLGGVLTDLFAWNWIFLVNLPIGAAVFFFALRLLPDDAGEGDDRRLDVAGAVTVTAATMIGTYAVVNGNENGWSSTETLGLLAVSVALLVAFLVIESRVGSPLVPLGLFRRRNISVANMVGVLMAGSMFAWFFLSALYLQLVLGYSPLEVGLAFLPATLVMGAGSISLSDRLVMRYGIKPPLVGGLTLFAVGLLIFARAPGGRQLRGRRAAGHARHGDRRRHHVQPAAAGSDGRRRAEPGRPRVGHRQHGVHDGRRAGPRGAGERGRRAHRHPARRRRRPARGAHRRLPRRLHRRSGLRRHGSPVGAAAAAGSGARPRGAGLGAPPQKRQVTSLPSLLAR